MLKSSKTQPNAELKGVAAVGGLVMGVAHMYMKGNINIDPDPVSEAQLEEELEKFEQGRKSVGQELQRLTDFANAREDAETRDILKAQFYILQDPELSNSVYILIQEKKLRAEKAVYDSFQKYIDLIKSTEKSFLVTRLSDLRDIRDRLIHNIQQLAVIANFGKDAVMITEDVSPLEVVNFARSGVRGIVCNTGGLTSHASIIANAMGIPMVIDTKTATRQAKNGDTIIIDGNQQKVIFRPSLETITFYSRDIKRDKEEEKLLRSVIDKPAETLCGVKVSLQANIDFEDEVLNIEKYRAEGIGLLRTDTLLMNSGPISMDSKRQEEFCQTAYSGSGAAPVTVRLLDVGGDKVLDFKTKEANPFLGWRGVRVLLDRREMLRSQLDAICRVAGQYPGRTRILVPMISNMDEYLEVKWELDETQDSLRSRGVPIDKKIKLGVMVEVPSVALQTDLFASYADFFSIGTNDLTQYTMAVDRGNNLISKLYQPLHPSVLRLIKMTVKSGIDNRIPVSVCGEISSDPFAAVVLVGLGIRELSMTPRLIPRVKQAIRIYRLAEMENIAQKMLESRSPKDSAMIRKEWEVRFKEIRRSDRMRIEF